MDRTQVMGKDQTAAAHTGGAAAASIDSGLKSPLYHQIFVVLKAKIQSGELAVGSFLPSENEIAAEFAVSRITAKRALNDLAGAGLVVRERGRGTRVVSRPSPPRISASVEGWLENMSVMGRETQARVLNFGYVEANAEVAAALALDDGAVVQKAVRVRSQDGNTFSYLVTHIPEDIGRAFVAEDMARLPLLTLLERSGVAVSSARQIISATVADTTIAAALEVDVGAPLLEVRRVVYDQDGRAVEYIQALYRPDRYHYEVLLNRVSNNGANSWSPVANGTMSGDDTPISPSNEDHDREKISHD